MAERKRFQIDNPNDLTYCHLCKTSDFYDPIFDECQYCDMIRL